MPTIPLLDLSVHYNGNLSWLKDNLLYVSEYGSHAYGTASPTSDYDYRAVAIAPREYYTGILKTFETCVFDSIHPADGQKVDVQIYDVRVFAKHILQNNPSVTEMLWVDDKNVQRVHSAFLPFVENRHKFLSKRAVSAFHGYAVSQFKRIETHREWLLNPPTHKPTRQEYGLEQNSLLSKDQLGAAKAAIRSKLDEWSLDFLSQIPELDHGTRLVLMSNFERIMCDIHHDEFFVKEEIAAKQLAFDKNFIDYMKKEAMYEKACVHFAQYEKWKKDRNPERAEMERKAGYDLKHAMHLFRLTIMAKEILEEGIVRVNRPDSQELLDIRNGKYSYEELKVKIDALKKVLLQSAIESPLPNEADAELANQIVMKIIEEFNS